MEDLLKDLHRDLQYYRQAFKDATFDEYKGFFRGKIEVLTSVIERLELIINQNK